MTDRSASSGIWYHPKNAYNPSNVNPGNAWVHTHPREQGPDIFLRFSIGLKLLGYNMSCPF
jgi:hypothetical protein